MIKEHDRIALKTNIPAEKLNAGDVGTVIHVHKKARLLKLSF
jgi:hypothetical protein